MDIQGEKDNLKFLPKVSLICRHCTFVELYICTFVQCTAAAKGGVKSEKFVAVKQLKPEPGLFKATYLS